jgi:hypothetical protein
MAAAYFRHQSSHFKLLLIYMPPPITRRVAGICPEKWIALRSETAVSPCPDANKENFSAGPF